MAFDDKDITCVECGHSFVFTASEQETYQQRGFMNEPKRCFPCRSARKQRVGAGGGGGFGGRGRGDFGGGGGGRSDRGERHTVTCAECGKEASVPFKPRGDRPVYCGDCFRARRG